MFGYVKVEKAELKVKEFEFYRGTYCGLCRAMGKCTGQCSRMTLNYDFVFLALVRMAISPVDVSFEQKRCLVHPLEKKNSMVRNEVLDYCAYASAILNYQKIKDDIADEKGAKKLRACLALPFVAHARKKAIKRSPSLKEIDQKVSERLVELASIEKGDSTSVDLPAASFGVLLGDILSFGLEGSDARITYELGKNIGAWIYMADAIDDMPEDIKKGRYNAFVKLYGGRLPTQEELVSVLHGIRNHLYGAEAAFDLFETDNDTVENIIKNILYLGIPEMTDRIINSSLKESVGKESSND